MSQEPIPVCVRLRPFLQDEEDKCVLYFGNDKIIISKSDQYQQQFNFKETCDPYIDQEQIFLQLGMPMIQNAQNIFSSNLVIYGGKTSGKTFTLVGSEASLFSLKQNLVSVDSGLIVRLTQHLLMMLSEMKIYLIDNEQIITLFQCNIFTSFADWVKIAIDTLEKLPKALAHIVVEYKTKSGPKIRVIQIGNLSKSSQNGMQTHNKSIFTLHRCLNSLIELQKQKKFGNKRLYVPFRESKLTNLLSESFQGQADLKILLCLAPVNYEDALGTLMFGQQFQQVLIKRHHKQDAQKMVSSELSQFQSLPSGKQPEVISMAQHKLKMQEQAEMYEQIIEYLQRKLIKLA